MVESYERKEMANKNRDADRLTGSSPPSLKRAMKESDVKITSIKGASPLVSVQNGTSPNVGKAPSAPPPKK